MRWLAVALFVVLAGCRGGAGAPDASATARATIPLTIVSGGKRHAFAVEVAKTPEAQQRGLMFRTTIPADGGMLFAPYPAAGGGAQVASFWMKNTPSALDIIFIRSDRTIANIEADTIPFSEAPVSSSEPVSAVLELRGGRAAELGIGEGDRVEW
ncbi:DUF192 domain-containing protein [Sphingomonas adhaesiva]|uniref:DUF192 domain-containing protein n=1 Tax=Sphingomonas adhaesiva TaxID=28212 RepID=UPI002FF92602